MSVKIEKIEQNEVLVADLGSVKLYKVIENEESTLESTIESES